MVWSGAGTINGWPVAPPAAAVPGACGEFLCTPGGTFEVRAEGESPLLIYTFFPLLAAGDRSRGGILPE